MSYVAIPEFVDGEILSATKLNQLRNNVEHVYGRANQVNPARYRLQVSVTEDASGDVRGVLVHRYNTLQYYLSVSAGALDWIDIRYDTTVIWTETVGTFPAGTFWSGVIDLTPFGFVIGQVYTLKVTINGTVGNSTSTALVSVLQELP